MAHGCICDNCGAYTSDSFGNEEYDLLCEGCYDELGDSDEPHGNPYDDEADLAYSDTARGEEGTPAIPLSMNSPRYPPRQSQGPTHG